MWDIIKEHTVTYPQGYEGQVDNYESITYTIDLLDGDVLTWQLNVDIELVFQLETEFTYGEDETIVIYNGVINVDDLILDTDNAGKQYICKWSQSSPNDQVGSWKKANDSTVYQGEMVVTGNKNTINSTQVTYAPPGDYTDPITLRYEQARFDPATDTTVIQVSNFRI